jgi:hypothetical protein
MARLKSGEYRGYYQCKCGWVFIHEFIPYGLGQGRFSQRCGCQLTSHTPFKEITKKEYTVLKAKQDKKFKVKV